MLISKNKLVLRELLDEKYKKYANSDFIKDDPIQIPHKYSKKEDIEISALLTATISWGNRKSIVNNANNLLKRMGNSPYEFVVNFNEDDSKVFSGFVHRTFNSNDCIHYIKVLNKIYNVESGLEQIFTNGFENERSVKSALERFRNFFLANNSYRHTLKHVSDVSKGSAAKRINMFLRWMIRTSKEGVDFGIWKGIPTSALMMPLDVHSGRTARELGLLNRNQNDWKSVEELTNALKEFDSSDPVKYDFALFGIGVNKKLEFSLE
ncbi:MAG: TIGR02757 family protein [Tenuifilaceae bacterium]